MQGNFLLNALPQRFGLLAHKDLGLTLDIPAPHLELLGTIDPLDAFFELARLNRLIFATLNREDDSSLFVQCIPAVQKLSQQSDRAGSFMALLTLADILVLFENKSDIYDTWVSFSRNLKVRNTIADAMLEPALRIARREATGSSYLHRNSYLYQILEDPQRILHEQYNNSTPRQAKGSHDLRVQLNRVYRASTLLKILLRIACADAAQHLLSDRLPLELVDPIVCEVFGLRYGTSGDFRKREFGNMFAAVADPKNCAERPCPTLSVCPQQMIIRWSKNELRFFHTHYDARGDHEICKWNIGECPGHFHHDDDWVLKDGADLWD